MENNKHDDKRKHTEPSTEEKKKSTISAAGIDAITGSPVAAARSHTSSGNMGSTGTNVSYEGETAEGGAGSAGTGYNDDQTGAVANANKASDAENSATMKAPSNKEDTAGNP